MCELTIYQTFLMATGIVTIVILAGAVFFAITGVEIDLGAIDEDEKGSRK